MAKCPACDREVDPQAKFCLGCGRQGPFFNNGFEFGDLNGCIWAFILCSAPFFLVVLIGYIVGYYKFPWW